MHIFHFRSVIAFGLLTVGLYCSDAISQTANAPITRPARPQMPDHFDLDTVQSLITDIDKPLNASILKVGYFLRRGQPELPTIEGLALLKTASDAEPIGTRRWFLLQGLLAFAAFRVEGADTATGFTAYGAMFTHAADAAQSKAEYPLRQAITEFVAAVPGKFRDLGLNKDDQTRETLFKAWTAYVVVQGSPSTTKSQVVEPMWTTAITEADASEAFVPLVEKVMTDASAPKTFGVLFTAASVVADKKPDRAVLFLQQAKPLLLLQSSSKLDLNQVARFYTTLVDLLASLDRLPDAISTQREFVKLTGRGQAKLLLLTRKSGDHAEVERLLTMLNEPTNDDQEINEAALGLFALSENAADPDPKAGEQAVLLLTSYLALGRKRVVEEELNARLMLGHFYLQQHNLDAMQSILTFTTPPGPISSRVRSLLRDVERMRMQK